MNVEEFCMFIHSPFATNIHIDAQQVRSLKTVIARQPLSLTEFNILKSLKSVSKQLKTSDDIIKEVKQETKVTSFDVSSALNNLVRTQYVEKSSKPVLGGSTLQESGLTQKMVGTKIFKRFYKDFFSITQEGKNKLENDKDKGYYKEIDPSSEVEIEKENEVNRVFLDQFWKGINAEENITKYRFPEQEEESEEDVSFFRDEDRPVLLAIFPFADFSQKLSLKPNKPDVHLEFKKNTIYLYPSGVGMFSSQIIIRYSDDINEIKNELELKVKKIIQENFKNQGSESKLENFYNSIKHGHRFKLVDIDRFEVESDKVNNPAWTHIIYWFYEKEFFEYDTENGQNLKSNFNQEFTDLLEQPPENTLFLKNRLVFYGWGRSLILTDKLDQNTEKWVRNKVNLVEVGQYSTFGHRLLDYLLQRVLLKLTIEEPVIDQSAQNLNKGIEYIDNVRPVATVFLEEFRSGINTILHAGAPFLVKTLESQWRLDKVEESIRNKLESLNKERSAMEQLVITQKQDRMNIISSAFTIMGIASVTAAIVTLSPLKNMLEKETLKVEPFFTFNEILLFIISTIIIIGIAITIIFKWHDIKHKIYHKYYAWNEVRNVKKDVRKVKKDITNLDPNLEEAKEKMKQLGIVRRKVKNLFYKKMMSKSQYNKLENEIQQYMQKITSR